MILGRKTWMRFYRHIQFLWMCPRVRWPRKMTWQKCLVRMIRRKSVNRWKILSFLTLLVLSVCLKTYLFCHLVFLLERFLPKGSSRCQTRRGRLSWSPCSGTLLLSFQRSVSTLRPTGHTRSVWLNGEWRTSTTLSGPTRTRNSRWRDT